MEQKNLKTASFCFFLLWVSAPCQPPTIRTGIPVPEGYVREVYPEGTFSRWLQDLPLKDSKTIASHNGSKVWGLIYNVYAVVDKPLLFKQDLEQCADYCMRFWADYHQETGKLRSLYLFDYGGKKKYYSQSGKSYRAFLQQSMGFSNSHSIKQGGLKVHPDSLRAGDMFVQNKSGGIGHVSFIVDVCRNDKGEKRFLIGYSFMPAQEFHIEKAGDDEGNGGWFSLEGYRAYLGGLVFGRYGEPALRRFGP